MCVVYVVSEIILIDLEIVTNTKSSLFLIKALIHFVSSQGVCPGAP